MKRTKKQWGKTALINLINCNDNIKKPEKIKEFFSELCKEIKMNQYGPLYLKRFGRNELRGFSAMQFIETSSIVAHFDEKIGKRAFIDIFSCKEFNERKAEKFCKKFFGAENSSLKTIVRG